MDCTLRISEEKTQAFLLLTDCDEISSSDVLFDRLLEFLKDSNITDFLIKKNIEQIAIYRDTENEYLIAKSIIPIPSEPAKIVYLFDTYESTQEEGSKLDYKQFSPFIFVRKGMAIAKKIPVSGGKPGRDVYGTEIPVPHADDLEIPMGQNVLLEQGNPLVCVAGCSGVVEVARDGKIHVNPAFQTENHVDFSTGNIEFDGCVSVKGDVKSGFHVKATGNIEILGTIEDALIESENSIACKFGFVGHGKGKMVAENNIVLNHVENQTLFAGKDIIVHSELIDANVASGTGVFVEKGRIVGGTTEATRKIVCLQLGCAQETRTTVVVGTDQVYQNEIARLVEIVVNKENDIKKIQHQLKKFELFKLRKHKFTPEMVDTYKKCLMAEKILQEDVMKTIEKLEELQGTNPDFRATRIIVKGTLYPNVHCTIGDQSFITKKSYINVHLKLEEGKIAIVNN